MSASAGAATIYKYGEHENQWVRLTPPQEPWARVGDKRPDGLLPVAVLIHGGYWKQKWNADNTCITGLAPDLAARGFAVVEVEYRRIEDEGGGWPGCNQDCLSALDSLKRIAQQSRLPLDLGSVTLIGHSAGGALALWVSAKAKEVVPCLVVAVAPVSDLFEGYRAKLSDEGDAVQNYMKCTPETPEGVEAYTRACPTKLLPVTVPTLVVQGSADEAVPPYLSLNYHAKAVEAGERADKEQGSSPAIELLELPGADHFHPLTFGNEHWHAVLTRMLDMLNQSCSRVLNE